MMQRKHQTMTGFADKVQAMAIQYQKRLRATMRTAVQETVADAQKVENEGGRMHVDTGFLRASVMASTGQMPSGESVNPDPNADGVVFQYEGTPVVVAILNWQPGETLYVGWTANYARPREYRDGFLRGATEQWGVTVDRVAHNVRRRM